MTNRDMVKPATVAEGGPQTALIPEERLDQPVPAPESSPELVTRR